MTPPKETNKNNTPRGNLKDTEMNARLRTFLPFLVFALGILLIAGSIVLATSAHAQTVGTYTEDSGVVKNRTGVSTRGATVQTPLDGSGTTSATANTSQVVFPVNVGRVMLSCQNPLGSTGVLRINIGAPATPGQSWELAAGTSFTNPPNISFTGTVNVSASVASMPFICKQG